MAPSSGHLLVPKAWRVVRFAFEKTTNFLRTKAPQAGRSVNSELQPIYVRNTTRQPIPRAAALRQGQSRWFSRLANNPTVRSIASSAKSGASFERASLPKSRIGAAVNNLTQRAPFASTLRPNLTGGTLSRTAGGYGLGSGRAGGARYFSHTPAAPAQVISNVSAAVRAFWISGQKAQFDGISPRSGEKRYRAVSTLQEETGRKLQTVPKTAPGSYIDFQVSPTITAFGPLSTVQGASKSLNADGVIDLLSIDFARALKDLAIIMNDLKRLSSLGDLPLSMQDQSTLRVRFPGCDARTVERLCDEVGVQRGVIRQDENFDVYAGVELALLFPFAPSRAPSIFTQSPEGYIRREKVDWQNMLSPDETTTSPGFSRHSDTGLDYEDIGAEDQNPWLSSPSGYSSLHASEDDDDGAAYFEQSNQQAPKASDFEGLEGIYKFLEECDRAKR